MISPRRQLEPPHASPEHARSGFIIAVTAVTAATAATAGFERKNRWMAGCVKVEHAATGANLRFAGDH
jgi:hypothetical protein